MLLIVNKLGCELYASHADSSIINRMNKGPSIYDAHTEGEGVRLRWAHVDGGRGVKPHVDVHTEN